VSAAASLGLDSARAVDPSLYRISGAEPRFAVKPTSIEEVAELIRACAGDNLGVVPWGGGISLHMITPPAGYDAVVDLTALDRIVQYDADDLTLTAECGITLEALRRAAAANGQELPLEGSRAERATLGGTLAANGSGPRRMRFGAPVDRILGARFVLGDGTLARSGGRVVKNVAGYALHRLLCGSRGGLAVLVEASVKLMPAPEVRVALVHALDAREVLDSARWTALSRLEVAGLSIVGAELARTLHVAAPTPSDFIVVTGLEEHRAWLAEQETRVTRALGAPVARLEGDEVLLMWQSLADLEELPAPRLSFTTSARTPAALAPLVEAGHARGAVFHAPAGRLHVHLDPREAGSLAERMRAGGFTLLEARGATAERPALPASAVTTMRGALGRALDPGARFALGGAWRA
jgi:FAD/FMN-containing dehydrogenase